MLFKDNNLAIEVWLVGVLATAAVGLVGPIVPVAVTCALACTQIVLSVSCLLQQKRKVGHTIPAITAAPKKAAANIFCLKS